MSCGMPTASKLKSGPSPPVNSLHFMTELSLEPFTVCVAPKCRAISSLLSATSTAMIFAAPASRAPWMIDRPTPPQPNTATDEPGVTFAVLIAAPTPVITPQPTSAALSSGIALSITQALIAGTITSSAMQPRNCITPTSEPSLPCTRAVPSSMRPCGAPTVQNCGSFALQYEQLPQAGANDSTT